LVEPIVANETFSHAVFFDNQTNNLVKTQAIIFGGLVEIKGKAIETCSWFQVSRNLMGLSLRLYFVTKIVALQLITLKFSCPMSFLRQNGAVFYESRPFLRLLN
jgi:hypothetical protein